MCRIWAQGVKFQAVCEIINPKADCCYEVPFVPILWHDDLGTRKPVGVPLDRPIEVEGPLVFVGFGITKKEGDWDDYRGQRIDGKIALVLSSVPNSDFNRFPIEPYGTNDHKVVNALRHGARAIVWVDNPLHEPNELPRRTVTQTDDIVGICIGTRTMMEALWTHQDPAVDLYTLQKQIEEKLEPMGPVSLNLNLRISFKGNEFKKRESEHFIYFYHSGSLAERELPQIIENHEEAYTKISETLRIEQSTKMRCFLFPSMREKTFYTYHVGAGFASGQTIIEVYNNEIKVDPFHELTHVLAGRINQSLPALFDEGLAVYMQKGSVWNGKHVDQWVKEYLNEGKLIPIKDLLSFPEIGSIESKPSIAYPEAGSFVKHLIDSYGIEKFRQVLHKIQKGKDKLQDNKRLLNEIIGKELSEIERDWLITIREQ